ncbi:3'-5' exonuclease [Sutterella sp.]|uniref:3'-5' exonuclease n=1 Tax=Sutterella sp. TaxID=1981025 RepID=UPI0026DF68DA|nr:3'-5' exonuclease [Sutterella sp.]MDO5532301.1 3'-5' exonuclease [Sutterella sp.]
MKKIFKSRICLTKDSLLQVGGLTSAACAEWARFFTRCGFGVKVDVRDFPGASAYKVAVLKGGLHVLLRMADDFYLALQVGPEATVTEWAATHRCEVNPTTGQLQIYGVAEPQPGTGTPSAEEKTPLFADISEADLLEIGTPAERFELVRSIRTEEELTRAQNALPQSVYEILTCRAQGEAWASLLASYRESSAFKPANPDSPMGTLPSDTFHIIESETELKEILEKPLDLWRVYLHPSQKKIVETDWKGPVRVTGGAGTGKTVVAMHRAKYLVELPDWKPGEKLLFTTFTKNLSIDLAYQLSSLCSGPEMKCIEVKNIDGWIGAFLRRNGVTDRIIYPGSNDPAYRWAWSQALTKVTDRRLWPESFLREEWERIVLEQNVTTLRGYLFVPRTGRGRPLSRAERKTLWPVFEEMRLQLSLAGFMMAEDATYTAIDILTKEYPQGLYRAVIADEIQDFSPSMLRLLRALTPDRGTDEKLPQGDLFLAGDTHQRIYGEPVVFSNCGIAIRGRSKKLRLNYRTTDEIRRAADTVWEGRSVDDMEGGAEERTGYTSLMHGAKPVCKAFSSSNAEVLWIADQIRALTTSSPDRKGCRFPDICIVCRRNRELDDLERALLGLGIRTARISRNRADDPDQPGVRIATMHRVKGLEFKVVFISGMQEGNFPLLSEDGESDEDQLHALTLEARERALFYVSASRAVEQLYLTAAGDPGIFMKALMD